VLLAVEAVWNDYDHDDVAESLLLLVKLMNKCFWPSQRLLCWVILLLVLFGLLGTFMVNQYIFSLTPAVQRLSSARQWLIN
jgi:hypothetical protein